MCSGRLSSESSQASTTKNRVRVPVEIPPGYRKGKPRCQNCATKHGSCLVPEPGGRCQTCVKDKVECEHSAIPLQDRAARVDDLDETPQVDVNVPAPSITESAVAVDPSDILESFTPLETRQKAARVELMFLRLLMETNVIYSNWAMSIARFFGAHFAFQGYEPGDPTVGLLDVDGVTGINGNAMYLLFKWRQGLEPSTAVVQVSFLSLNILICSPANERGTANKQSLVEWFLSPDSDATDSDSVKDILIVSGRELGLVCSEYFTAIMFHQKTGRFSKKLTSPSRENEIQRFCTELAAEIRGNSGPQVAYPWSFPAEWQTIWGSTGEAHHIFL